MNADAIRAYTTGVLRARHAYTTEQAAPQIRAVRAAAKQQRYRDRKKAARP